MVYQLAVDRPSHKFVSFLKKYHGFKNAIPQVGHNYFSVSCYRHNGISKIMFQEKIALNFLSTFSECYLEESPNSTCVCMGTTSYCL